MPAKDAAARKVYAARGSRARWGDRTLADRFWEKVSKDGPIVSLELGPCWMWQAYIGPGGYGQFTVKVGYRPYAHRMSWVLAHGEIPEGLSVLHKCDNRSCVRPDHLFLGTTSDNMKDAAIKNRVAYGSRNGMAKFTEEDVRQIRTLYDSGLYSQKAIAEVFSSTQPMISIIVRGKKWVRNSGPMQDEDLRSKYSGRFTRKDIEE